MSKNACFCFVSSGYAPVVAKVNIITMAVNTLANRGPYAPCLPHRLETKSGGMSRRMTSSQLPSPSGW